MATRRTSKGGARRKRGGGSAGLGVLSYLAVAALGAVVALAVTGRIPLPEWPSDLVAQVDRMARGEDDQVAVASPQPKPKPEPRRPAQAERGAAERNAAERRPDTSIRTSALPVPRPQRPVPERKAEPQPLPVVARPPAGLAPTPPASVPGAPSAPSARVTRVAALAFPLCGDAPARGCVVDGDTFVLDGKAIRVADIDTPESGDPKCRREAQLAEKAKLRLRDLLSAGPVELVAGSRDVDVYGRKLRTVLRDGRSLGDTLIAEGLARRWTGRKTSWCS